MALDMICDPKFVTRLAAVLILKFSETFKNGKNPLPTDIRLVEKWINDVSLEETIVRWANQPIPFIAENIQTVEEKDELTEDQFYNLHRS